MSLCLDNILPYTPRYIYAYTVHMAKIKQGVDENRSHFLIFNNVFYEMVEDEKVSSLTKSTSPGSQETSHCLKRDNLAY